MRNNRFLLLLAISLFVFVPFSVNAETEYSKIYVTIDNPQEDVVPDTTATLRICNTDETICQDVENAELEWYVYGNDENALNSTDTFQKDVKYYFLFTEEWDEKLYNEYKMSDSTLVYVNNDEYRPSSDYFYINHVVSMNIVINNLIVGQPFPTTAETTYIIGNEESNFTIAITAWKLMEDLSDVDPTSLAEKDVKYVPQALFTEETTKLEEKTDFRTKRYVNGQEASYIVAKEQEEIKLIFDSNGGTFKDGTTTLEINDIINFNYENLIKPTRDGYKFVGFYTEKTGGTSYYDLMNSEAGIEEDTTFYARWEVEEENPKTFDEIGTSIFMGTLSLIGLIGATIYLRKKVRA